MDVFQPVLAINSHVALSCWRSHPYQWHLPVEVQICKNGSIPISCVGMSAWTQRTLRQHFPDPTMCQQFLWNLNLILIVSFTVCFYKSVPKWFPHEVKHCDALMFLIKWTRSVLSLPRHPATENWLFFKW